MKRLLISLGITGALIVLMQGCYTQIATDREDDNDRVSSYRDRDDSDTSAVQNDEDSYRDNGGYTYDENGNWVMRPRFGFSYYYPTYWPSVYFANAYADPWYFGFGCDPWYYPAYGYYPSYGYAPYYGYHSPWYYPHYYGYGVAYGTGHKQDVRTLGSTRTPSGGRPDVGGRGGTNVDLPSGVGSLPTGVGRSGGTAPAVKRTDNGNAPVRESGSVRVAPARRDVQSGSGKAADRKGRNTGSRGSINRGSHPYTPPADRVPSYTPPHRDSGSHASPAPSVPRSAPAAPSGGGASRGGSTRGGRP